MTLNTQPKRRRVRYSARSVTLGKSKKEEEKMVEKVRKKKRKKRK